MGAMIDFRRGRKPWIPIAGRAAAGAAYPIAEAVAGKKWREFGKTKRKRADRSLFYLFLIQDTPDSFRNRLSSLTLEFPSFMTIAFQRQYLEIAK